jgi:hypothetical protein
LRLSVGVEFTNGDPPGGEAGKVMRRTVIAATDDASGPSVDRVDCLVRADVDIGHIRRLTLDVFPRRFT